ncbi:MAG: undecaprenyl-diphosphate phosphatase, partial [Halobacteriovoraceae bacterium]|nr:undecaprenyl-diphosphate phosphatase [Halobacteriovoraceae bacterium]
MDIYWAMFYGFIQGVTEFLPVSSSGHLALIPYFFKLQDPGVLFDLMMHLGTAIAVILYFHQEVLRLILETKKIIMDRNLKDTVFCQNFLISTFFSFILILIIKKTALTYGRSPLFIGFNFIFFGILMYIADRKNRGDLDLTQVKGFKKSILIGLSQSLAIFPGVSRSGITLTTSRFLGMNRLEASRFSFLLSLPVILGSILFKLPEILSGSATPVSLELILIGVFGSFF